MLQTPHMYAPQILVARDGLLHRISEISREQRDSIRTPPKAKKVTKVTALMVQYNLE
jgi:hypothetical protein